MNPKKGSVFITLIITLLITLGTFSHHLQAEVLVMDDFNDGAAGNLFGGGELAQNLAANTFISTISFGNTGFSREFQHPSSGVYNSIRQNRDLSDFRYVSFRIRGLAGGENLLAQMDDNSNFPQVQINSFLPDGITTEFQKVVISTDAFFAALIDWSSGANGTFAVAGSAAIATVAGGKVYIDDIRFGSSPSPIWWDTFNDGGAPFNYGNDFASFISSVGPTITPSYDNTLFSGATGFSYKIIFVSTTTTTNSVILIRSTGTTGSGKGLNLTGTDTLSFQIAGSSNAVGINIGVGLSDHAGAESVVNLTAHRGGGIPSAFDEVRIPLTAFTGPVPSLDTTHIKDVQLWSARLASPQILAQTTFYSINIDNIQFMDTSTPTAPTSLQNGGNAVTNGSVINTTGAFTVTADAGSTDATLEEIRFEHDNLTGGASWFIIDVDTDLANTTYQAEWFTQSLLQDASYQIRVQALDVQGNVSTLGPFTVQVATEARPVGVTGFQIGTTSVTVSLASNGNPNGTTFSISTGSFETSSSSAGKITTLTLSNLIPNTTYSINARSENGDIVSTASVVASSTATVPAIPGTITFTTISGSAITISWDRNGNPLTAPTSYQVQVSTSNTFIGSVTSSETFVVQSTTAGLLSNNTYFFRVRAFGVIGDTSAFNQTVSTVTGANSPGVVNFQVFTTSVSVTLAPNGNPAGTTFSITTGSFETSSSSSGLSEAGNTTLVLSSLVPNTTYSINTRSSGITISSTTLVASTNTAAAVPGSITFTSVNASAISFNWGANGNPLTPPTSYQVQVSTSNGFIGAVTSSITFVIQSSSSGLQVNNTYFVRVRAFDVGGGTSAFNTIASTLTAAVVPSTPSALTVTAITTNTITFAWVDNSSNESGFNVLNSTLGILGSVSANTTFFQLTGLSPNTLVMSSGVVAVGSIISSTLSAFISSYTLANPPTLFSFVSIGGSSVTVSWNANNNLSTVLYEVSQSTDNFVFTAGISTPIPFSSQFTFTSATISNLQSETSYFFRVRGRNGDVVVTTFTPVISTFTLVSTVIISTGGAVGTGLTTITADAGVSITNNVLSNGSTQQTLVSTETAVAVFGNGFSLTLSSEFEVKVVAGTDRIQLTSSGTVPITESGFTIELTSGTVTVQTSADILNVTLTTDAVQNVLTAIPTSGEKKVNIVLNPPSGSIRTSIAPGTLKSDVRLRVKVPDTFPDAGAINASKSFGTGSLAALPLGAPAILEGFAVGLEILLDMNIQPILPVPITIHYREQDLSGSDAQTVVVARFEETAQKWLTLPTEVNASGRVATAVTNHFSKFQLMSLSPASDISGAKAFPNPLQVHQGQTEFTFTNLSANAGIKIYTILGELVRVLVADVTGTVRWDARNSFGRLVGSGMYLALIEDAGGKQKVLKLMVEK